ncbi:hypothetical protein QBC34DRAFT_439651 [Podospora aff. communis PSN243]|uniref:Ankyrin repeat protein n=1 Tax=Podospora aff. communis PSN243 TaxID=3040156 RepID=A0AAV9GHL1_9PEZI|nr:hypothetical protein QBC34DRAFT_439651 [Podospora aff. communis PSN243]
MLRTSQDGAIASVTLWAVKIAWSRREIDDIENKLNGFRCQILLQIAKSSQKKLDEIAFHIAASPSAQSRSPETDHLHHDILAKLDTVERFIQERRDGSIDTRHLFSPLSTPGTSVEVNTGTFTALHSQCDDGNSPDNLAKTLQDALRPPFEKYQELFLSQVRKEIRGSARAELEAIKLFMGQALTELHCETQETAPAMHAPPESPLSSLKVDSFDMSLIPNPYARGTNIGDIDCVETYSKAWEHCIKTRVHPDDVVAYYWVGHFDRRDTAIRVRQDTRGWPSLFPSLEVFRVLPRDEEVWRLLKLGEVEPIQLMFAQGTLHPLDRNSYGRTLLHHAANYDHFDLCRFLVQVGCRTTEADMDGMLPEDLALLPKRLRPKSGLHRTFRYLREKREESRSYLPPEQKNDEVMVARICRTSMVANDPWFIRPWAIHCMAMDIDLTKLPLLLFNLCLRRESRSTFIWHPFLQDIEEKNWWSRKIARRLFRELCRTEIPSNPTYEKGSLLHLVTGTVIDLFQTNTYIGKHSSVRNLVASLTKEARKDYKTLSWIVTSILQNGGDIHVRDGDNESMTDYFCNFGLLSVWEDILLDSGLVPLMVFEEDKRRKEGTTAAATTHDFGDNCRDLHSFAGMRRRSVIVY